MPSRMGSPPVNGARLQLGSVPLRVQPPLFGLSLSLLSLANFYRPFKTQARQAHSRGFPDSAARQASSVLPL